VDESSIPRVSRLPSSAKPVVIAPVSPAGRSCSPIACCAHYRVQWRFVFDRMIALVEGAIRQRTPNEIALTLVLLPYLDLPYCVVPPAHGLERGTVHDGVPGHHRAAEELGTDVPTQWHSWCA